MPSGVTAKLELIKPSFLLSDDTVFSSSDNSVSITEIFDDIVKGCLGVKSINKSFGKPESANNLNKFKTELERIKANRIGLNLHDKLINQPDKAYLNTGTNYEIMSDNVELSEYFEKNFEKLFERYPNKYIVLQKNPNIIIQDYDSLREAFDATINLDEKTYIIEEITKDIIRL